jgi:hypothetical protein
MRTVRRASKWAGPHLPFIHGEIAQEWQPVRTLSGMAGRRGSRRLRRSLILSRRGCDCRLQNQPRRNPRKRPSHVPNLSRMPSWGGIANTTVLPALLLVALAACHQVPASADKIRKVQTARVYRRSKRNSSTAISITKVTARSRHSRYSGESNVINVPEHEADDPPR